MRHILFAFVCFCMFSCQESVEPPELTQEELTDLLLDIHTARIAVLNGLVDDRDSLESVYSKQIATIHGLSDEELDQILDGLESELEELNSIFTRLTDRIETMKDSLSENN